MLLQEGWQKGTQARLHGASLALYTNRKGKQGHALRTITEGRDISDRKENNPEHVSNQSKGGNSIARKETVYGRAALRHQ